MISKSSLLNCSMSLSYGNPPLHHHDPCDRFSAQTLRATSLSVILSSSCTPRCGQRPTRSWWANIVNALHSSLDLIIRTNARATLPMLGYATSGVVLSSVCAAEDLAYHLVVVEDCRTD